MPLVPFPVQPGPRTLLALTCSTCGKLKPGEQFGRAPRVKGGPAYLDRRCRPCRWSRMETSIGRDSVGRFG